MRQMIAYNKPLYTFQDAMRWTLNIAEAIAFMHSLRPIVIHRDLKCDNILLAGEKGSMTAKIADFGLHARLDVTDGGVDTDQLNNGYELTGKTGAFTYMSPEVLLSKPYNEKVDVFSFGIIMCELFSKTLIATQYMNTTEYDETMK
jgi:serine/threonine protein kinase